MVRLFEVCVDSVESAVAAAKGGADRIELCASLIEGGLTPTVTFLEVVKSLISVPVFAMVRPRGGSMVYTEAEKRIILGDTQNLVEGGADGIVFGALLSNGELDEDLCFRVIKIAHNIPCTFHRAFDTCLQPFIALEKIINLGFCRILTSGGEKTAMMGKEQLKKLVVTAGDRIIIVAGSGVNSLNCLQIVEYCGVTELHGSARKPVKNSYQGVTVNMGTVDDSTVMVTSAEEVQKIQALLPN